MYNPFDTIRRWQSRIGKPIRPIIELQKNGSIVNILTTTVQTEQMISDTYHTTAWEVMPSHRSHAVYVDGVYKGQGFFAGEEGCILTVEKEVIDDKGYRILFSYSGIFGKLLDASLIERGSALKASTMQILIWSFVALAFGFMAGMSYG